VRQHQNSTYFSRSHAPAWECSADAPASTFFRSENYFSFPRAKGCKRTFFLVPTRQRGNAVSTAPAVLDGLVISLVRRKLVSKLAPLARCLLHSHAPAWERVKKFHHYDELALLTAQDANLATLLKFGVEYCSY
jgi:hypothetical protein